MISESRVEDMVLVTKSAYKPSITRGLSEWISPLQVESINLKAAMVVFVDRLIAESSDIVNSATKASAFGQIFFGL